MGAYRYGFNGKEKNDEIQGAGNTYDYGMRESDPRIGGRFWSVDPLTKKYPELSPYQFAGNTPIWATDLDGAEPNPFNLLKDQLFRDFTSNTTTSFISAAAKNGFFREAASPTTFITRIGRIYEDAVLRSLGEEKNTKTFRPALTSPKGVIPDVVGPSILNRIDPSDSRNTEKIVFPEAAFTDAKFKGNVPLSPTFNPDQLKIMIDVLSSQKGAWINGKWDPNLKASDYGMAALTLITPQNGTLAPDLIEYATSKNVKLFQRFTQQDKDDPSRIRVAPLVIPMNEVPTNQGVSLPVKAPGQSVDVNWQKR